MLQFTAPHGMFDVGGIAMIRRPFLLLFALAPVAAAAGTRATFVDGRSYRQTIVIADNGDLDVELRSGGHLIIRGGRAFLVADLLTGPRVTPLDELDAAARERAATPRPPLSPERQAALDQAAADIAAAADSMAIDPDAPADPATTRPEPYRPSLLRRDRVVVNGRVGRGYYIPASDFQAEMPFAVISNDPALAPIGVAFRQGLAAQEVVRRAESDGPVSSNMGPADLRILESGTPLQYYDSRLRTVERVAIPSIALPAEPETGAALRARLAAEAADREATPAPERSASRALFAGGRLYLVAGNHSLLSLAEGEQALTRHDPGEPVLDACIQGGEPLALTGAEERAQSWTLRRLRSGQWQVERAIARADDEPLALTCTSEGAYLLTSRRFLDLTQPRTTELRIQGEPLQALVTAAVHVTPEAIFFGLNAGEFGGGLQRIDRRTGAIEKIERNATGELCGGPLNSGCDPVQGISNIPWRPQCVAAAVGLIHMLSAGRIVSVCPGHIDLLYAVAARELENPARAREAAQGGFDSVAFFGIAARGNSLIAIGQDGLYRLAADGTATHVPLPRFTRVEGVLVSFALPDVVLVVTGINGRASLSGSVPIMAVR